MFSFSQLNKILTAVITAAFFRISLHLRTRQRTHFQCPDNTNEFILFWGTLYIIISFKYNANLSFLYYLLLLFQGTKDKHA